MLHNSGTLVALDPVVAMKHVLATERRATSSPPSSLQENTTHHAVSMNDGLSDSPDGGKQENAYNIVQIM